MSELAIVDKAQERELAMMLGNDAAGNSGGGSRMPILKLNHDDEDDAGNPLKKGTFVLKRGDDEPNIYADKATIRPLINMYNWSHYVEGEGTVCKTITIPNFKMEPIDSNGGVRCGKPVSKVLKEMSKTEQNQYKDITCFRQLRCLVDIEGKTSDGEKATATNVPAIMFLKGANFLPFENEFTKVIPKSANLYDYKAELTTERLKNGGVTYFVIHFEPKMNDKLALDVDTYDTIKHMFTLIKEENERITEQYKKAVANRNADDAAIEALEADLVD
jgi:hypothetical protein